MPGLRFALPAFLTLTSCLTSPRMPEPPRTHPASPEAEEAPIPKRSTTLVVEAVGETPAPHTAPVQSKSVAPQASPHAQHQHGGTEKKSP